MEEEPSNQEKPEASEVPAEKSDPASTDAQKPETGAEAEASESVKTEPVKEEVRAACTVTSTEAGATVVTSAVVVAEVHAASVVTEGEKEKPPVVVEAEPVQSVVGETEGVEKEMPEEEKSEEGAKKETEAVAGGGGGGGGEGGGGKEDSQLVGDTSKQEKGEIESETPDGKNGEEKKAEAGGGEKEDSQLVGDTSKQEEGEIESETPDGKNEEEKKAEVDGVKDVEEEKDSEVAAADPAEQETSRVENEAQPEGRAPEEVAPTLTTADEKAAEVAIAAEPAAEVAEPGAESKPNEVSPPSGPPVPAPAPAPADDSAKRRGSIEKMSNYLRQFRNSAGFKKFTASQFMRVWNHYDSDGNGYISGAELDGFLKEFVISSVNEEQVRPEIISESAMALFKETFMDAFDENQDGMIDIAELAEILPTDENFLLLFHLKNPVESSVEFMRIWREYDKNCKGYIESKELKSFLKHMLDNQKTTVSDEKLNEYTETILNLFDSNRDGKLQLCEMARLMPVKQNFLSKPILKGASCITRSDIDRLFRIYDQNRNGTIEDEELSGLLKDLMDLGKKDFSLEDINNMKKVIMDHWDLDGDGTISKSELRMFLIQQCKLSAESQGLQYDDEDDDFDDDD